MLHGSLFNIKCTSFYCNYSRDNDFTDPIVPALAIPQRTSDPVPSTSDKTGEEAAKSLQHALSHTKASQQAELGHEVDISDERNPIPELASADLPHCPKCKDGLLRPGVVWFGESLPMDTLTAVDTWIEAAPKIDLMLVIGTSSRVWPAAGYVDTAREKGARVAVVNMDPSDIPGRRGGLDQGDWFFEGDAGAIVPEILKSVIGDI